MQLISLLYQADPRAFIVMVVAFTGVLAIGVYNLYRADAHLLPVWLVTNVWHYIKARPIEGSRTEIRELKAIIKDRQQGRW